MISKSRFEICCYRRLPSVLAIGTGVFLALLLVGPLIHSPCAMEKGGVGALELVAMDMKARGMYVCRTLSYKGAEFEVVEVLLDANMMHMYGKAAKFWAELRMELLSASTFLAEERPNSSQVWILYWASHQ
ncbi:udp-glycosyltransferase [Orobanche gracilis]